jgi:poly-gamma-glutamate capsule biosynthesis protein CapA/YwtB (metallophosphatase superfamily)
MVRESPAGQTLRVTAVGDVLGARRVSVLREPRFLALVDRVRAADVRFANLEMLVHGFGAPPAAESGGTYAVAEPFFVEELRWLGFNLLSRANNHATDYGIEGLLQTSTLLDAAGLLYAGVGRNLALARAPVYLDTAAGRVALLAASSTFAPAGRAGAQRPDLQGRPGLNPLRHRTVYDVDSQALAALRGIAEALGLEERRRQIEILSPRRPEDEGLLIFLDQRFRESERFGIATSANRSDLEDNLHWIGEARAQADWVFVSLHCHEFELHKEEPPAFAREFAHACIEAGADCFLGHGPHVLRGIELYQGKPILHGLGNFVFDNELVRFEPAELYEQFKLGPSSVPADVYAARTDHGSRGFPADPSFWESVLVSLRFEGSEIAELTLDPIELGYGLPRTRRGRPMLATAEQGMAILGRLSRLSEPFGTQIEVRDGRGYVQIGGTA